MIHCKNKCPLDKFNGCCRSCPDRPDCPEACEHDPADCGEATFDEETALAVFEKTQLATLNAIASLTAHKKAIEEQEKTMKAALFAAMEKYGIKKFESDVLTISYFPYTTATSVDSAKLKKKYPDIAAECSKTSSRAGYVKISLNEKGGGDSH